MVVKQTTYVKPYWVPRKAALSCPRPCLLPKQRVAITEVQLRSAYSKVLPEAPKQETAVISKLYIPTYPPSPHRQYWTLPPQLEADYWRGMDTGNSYPDVTAICVPTTTSGSDGSSIYISKDQETLIDTEI